MSRLFRTHAFRLAALYLILFAASVSALLAFIYFSTANFIERQTESTLDAELTGLAEQYQEHGLSGLVQIISERAQGDRRDDQTIYLVTDPEFHSLAGNLSQWPQAQELRPGWISFPVKFTRNGLTETDRARAATFLLPGNYHLLVGRDLRNADLFRMSVSRTLGWASLFTVALGVVGGFFMTRNMLRRVDQVNRTSERIIHGDLAQRVPLTGANDEFDQLATNLNAMLDQIERLMIGMRQVTDNIAHDLRTPLARLRARLEVTLLEKPDVDRYADALRQTIVEADRLLGTFNALLSIAEAEAGSRRDSLSVLDLAEIARSVAELYEPVADDKRLVLHASLNPDVLVRGDRHLLSQAIANLLDNALKYTPKGVVSLVVRRQGDRALVEVSDDGPGVPIESRETVFDRFVRMESSRSTPGNGLGLSLVRAVARLHDGGVRLEDHRPGAAMPGLKAILSLPLSLPAEAAQPDLFSANSQADGPPTRQGQIAAA